MNTDDLWYQLDEAVRRERERFAELLSYTVDDRNEIGELGTFASLVCGWQSALASMAALHHQLAMNAGWAAVGDPSGF